MHLQPILASDRSQVLQHDDQGYRAGASLWPMPDMDEILAIAQRYSLPVVEDACQAIGATYKDRKAGTMGDLGCFSFFPSKKPWRRRRRWYGGDLQSATGRARSIAPHSRISSQVLSFHRRIQTAAWMSFRRPSCASNSHIFRDGPKPAKKTPLSYGKMFQEAGLLSHVTPPAILPNRSHIFHQYVVRCMLRDETAGLSEGGGIGTEIYYPVSLHEQECFRYLGYAAADLLNSHAASKETLALPVYPELTDVQRRHVVNSIAAFYRGECAPCLSA